MKALSLLLFGFTGYVYGTPVFTSTCDPPGINGSQNCITTGGDSYTTNSTFNKTAPDGTPLSGTLIGNVTVLYYATVHYFDPAQQALFGTILKTTTTDYLSQAIGYYSDGSDYGRKLSETLLGTKTEQEYSEYWKNCFIQNNGNCIQGGFLRKTVTDSGEGSYSVDEFLANIWFDGSTTPLLIDTQTNSGDMVYGDSRAAAIGDMEAPEPALWSAVGLALLAGVVWKNKNTTQH